MRLPARTVKGCSLLQATCVQIVMVKSAMATLLLIIRYVANGVEIVVSCGAADGTTPRARMSMETTNDPLSRIPARELRNTPGSSRHDTGLDRCDRGSRCLVASVELPLMDREWRKILAVCMLVIVLAAAFIYGFSLAVGQIMFLF